MTRFKFYISSSRGVERIKYQPYGWEQAGYEMVRSETYGGLFRKYIVSSLDFIKDGRHIIKDLKESEGTECNAEFLVYRFEPLTHTYVICYTGKLVFSTYILLITAARINVADSGFEAVLTNRDDIPVDLTKLLSMDGNAIGSFSLEGTPVNFPSRLDYFRDVFSLSGTWNFTVTHSIPLTLVSYQTADAHSVVDPTSYTGVPGSIFTATDNGVRLITGSLHVTVNMIGTVSVKLNVYSGAGLSRYTELYAFSNVGEVDPGDIAIDLDIAENLTINAGEWLCFVIELAITDGTGTNSYVSDLVVRTRGITVPANISTGYMYHEAFTRIVQSITDEADPFYSLVLGRTDSEVQDYASDGIYSLGQVTSGKRLRGFDTPISCSLRDLFTSLKAVFNLGMAIETISGVKKVRIEPLDYFYQGVIVLTLSNCKDIEESVAVDMVANQVSVGYGKFENVESLDGIFEFNTKITYGNFIKSVKKELQLISPYRADDTGIQVAKHNPSTVGPEKEINTDEDNFLISLERDGTDFIPAQAAKYTSITGTVNDSKVYNVDYSPARNLRRHGSVLRGFLELYSSSYLIYTKQEKNSRLASQLIGGPLITEEADVLVSTLTVPRWETTKYTFESPIRTDDITLLQATFNDGSQDIPNMYGIIKFRMNADDPWKYGWILSMRVKDDGITSTAKFELLKVDPTYMATLLLS